MAGPKVSVDYITNTGITYPTSTPAWQHDVAGGTSPAVSTGLKPANIKRRYRMAKSTTTGKEFKVMVPDVTDTAWTSNNNTASAIAPPGHPTDTYVWAGRIGEKIPARGD
jgi:hypothetical protein